MLDLEEVKTKALHELRAQYDIKVLEKDSSEISSGYGLSQYWLLTIPVESVIFGIDQLELIIGLPSEFPLVLPKIFLPHSKYNELLTLPHIDQNRFICTYDEERAVPNPDFPAQQIRMCIYRAKKIIEAGLLGKNIEDYTEEFVAYWEQTYQGEERVFKSMLSSISEIPNEGSILDILILKNKIGSFDSIVLGNCSDSRRFRKFLDDFKYEYTCIKAFYLGSLNFGFPPFDTVNRDLNKLILQKKEEIQNEFFDFLNKNEKRIIIIFDAGINGYRRLQGLRISKLPKNAKGFRKGKLPAKNAFQGIASSEKIQRISLKPIHSKRLQKRTNGVIDTHKENNFAIAGLGSIGSNLMYFLSSFSNTSFYITDPDSLSTSNIARHFLGLRYSGYFKVNGLKHFFQHSNPNIDIKASTASIINVIDQKTQDLNSCSMLFICIGKWNIENWIAELLKEGVLTIPVCFIWVEPYLLGGHALYVHPNLNHFDDFFDEEGLFRQNVISAEEYNAPNRLLSLREAGCQSTFTPYSKEKVILFLSKLFPHLKLWISEKPEKSEAFTWIGYEEDELKGEISFSRWTKNCEHDISIISK